MRKNFQTFAFITCLKTVKYKTETKERKMETYVVGKQKNEN